MELFFLIKSHEKMSTFEEAKGDLFYSLSCHNPSGRSKYEQQSYPKAGFSIAFCLSLQAEWTCNVDV